LWKWQGRVNRTEYIRTGVVGIAVKLVLDYLVVTLFFSRDWTPLIYWRPFDMVENVRQLSSADAIYAACMLLLALPFVWIGVSMTAGYYRNWFGSFLVTDNTLVKPQDYEKWTVTAPSDPRLPGGGGYPITMYTMTAAAAARGADNYVTFETDYGPARINYWQGVDVTVNARLKGSLTLQAGTTTGRAINDTCATIVKVDSPDARNCRSVDPVETTLRGSASYTVPRLGVQVSASLRSQPPRIFSTNNPTVFIGIQPTLNPSDANWSVPNTVVQSILGRLPPGGLPNGTTTVTLVDNANKIIADNRRTQIDMRFAKIVRFGGRRADIGLDLQNLLNTNYGTVFESQYDYVAANGGTWLNPTTILGPRFVRVNLTFNF